MIFSNYFSPLSFPLLGLVRLPELSIPDATKGNTRFLKQLVWDGYLAKKAKGCFDNISEQTVIDRLRVEFSTFASTGIVDYLLLVWDILKWCDDNGIPRGPGRGSVNGSLSAYCCDIVKVNPLRHNLNFTRFISEARAKPQIIDGILYAAGKSLCDIDCDISFSQRDKVLAYIEQKYPGRVAKIANRLEMTGKTALKEVLKIYLGYSDEEARGISGNIEALFGKVETLSEGIEKHEELRKWIDESPSNREAVELAKGIESLGTSKGVHASGIYISYAPLDGNMPIECSKHGEQVTSYEMSVVAELGIKLDCLALKTVDIIHDTCKLVGINEDDIDINDPSIYRYLSSCSEMYGLFQIEDGLTKDVIRQVGPRHIDDLAACLAGSRPGALKEIGNFVKYVKTGEYKKLHPLFDEILKPTGGIILYQESINTICQQIYGMSAISADEVRRCIGKKDDEGMKKWEPVLYECGEKMGIPKETTIFFWNTCKNSADYLFSANHCYAYSYITAQTVYLKANHPREFMLSLFRMAKHETDTQVCINTIITECRKMSIGVLPPDLTRSENDFVIDTQGNIRFGISSIRGISEKTMEKVPAFKREFKSKFEIFEAAKAAGININVLATLFSSGCLRWKDESRPMLVLHSQLYNLLTDREKPLIHKLAPEYNEDLIAILKDLPNRKNEKGTPLIRESRLNTLRRDYARFWTAYKQNSSNEELCDYLHEKSLLGFSYSSSLYSCYSKKVVGLTKIADLIARKDKKDTETAASGDTPKEKVKPAREEPIKIVCFVEEVKRHTSKKDGSPYLKFYVYDDEAQFRLMTYGKERVDACIGFNGRLPKEGDILIAIGSLSKDGSLLFTDSVVVQPSPIALKPSEATEPI